MHTIGVAIAIPEPYGTQLQRHRASFGDPQADAIPTHVTLLPPTEVDVEDMASVEAHLQQAANGVDGFRMHLRGTATFRPISPVVFVAVTEGISSCEVLTSRVQSGVLAQEPRFPYHPHVTVAHDVGEVALDHAFKTLADFECAFDVRGFCLYRHGGDGVWRPSREFPLRS
ncbi:MAG TPA: 2'-5' RNA ligase family protein [Nocardioidaceae bacterium]|nr:2'-5' RNA ligase family protein [Nocardioidaceae bacterium]